MNVDPQKTAHHAVVEGAAYHFCSNGCRQRFVADPDAYLGKAPRVETVVEPGAVYTCPMHPEIEQVGPGNCPICEMALEPKTIAADAGPNHELVDMSRRLVAATVLTAPIFVLAMGEHLLGWHPLSGTVSNAVQFVLATAVVLRVGAPFFVRGWQSIVSRHLNMFTLIAIGTGAAWAYSVVATLAPQLFPAGFRDHDGSVATYFEAAAVIIVLVLLGRSWNSGRARAPAARSVACST